MQNRLAAWLESRGFGPADAARYVRSMHAGLAEIGMRSLEEPGGFDPPHRETSGGLNATSRRHLMEAGWFDEVNRALGAVEAQDLRLRS